MTSAFGNQQRDTDIRLVNQMLGALDEGAAPNLNEVREELLRVRERLLDAEHSEAASKELTALLTSVPERFGEVKMLVYRKVMQFLESETQKYATIREKRALTEEESRFGNEYLIPLIEQLNQLFSS